MPVKIWDRTDDGALTSRVETSRGDSYRGERYRADAEALDEEIDRMLDRAVALSAQASSLQSGQQSFVKRWSIGRALAESGLTESDHLEPAERRWLWLAIARKCRLGVRSDGKSEQGWGMLIPHRNADPGRIERDVFAMGRWLQEQDMESALTAFGASVTNVRALHSRGAIDSLNMRDALATWLGDLPPERRRELTGRDNFRQIVKALSLRFPARGPGSAKGPVHYSGEELREEVRALLNPIAAELAVDRDKVRH